MNITEESNINSFQSNGHKCTVLLGLKEPIYTANFTAVNPSWEAASCAATQEFPNILWDLQVHYRVHKRPPLVHMLNQINPAHTIPSYLRHILISSNHTRLCLPSGLFSSGFLTKILYAFLLSPFVLLALPISSSLTLWF
jgi:hypothetical protein